MKKNLQKVLVLALGLTTTIASAQWSANSTTWIDNTNSDDRSGTTRTTISADMSGVHVSGDHQWNTDGTTSQSVYEAYVSTDLMGYGTLTMGRQDLSFGSGALIGSNNWGNSRHTSDGANFAASFSGFDISAGTMGGINTSTNYINAAGSFSGVSINVLMIDNEDVKSSGYDLGYALMGGDLSLSFSMNDDGLGSEMTEMGASYNVFENMSIHASQRTYEGDVDGQSFSAPNSAWDLVGSGDFGHGNNGDEILSYGLSYDLGSIALSYNMHTTSHEGQDDAEATDMRVSYELNDNCTLGYRMLSLGDDNDYNTITISIGL